jgi:type VI protein secretion system component VasK
MCASVLELIRADQDWPMMRQFLTVGAVGFCSLALALGFYIPLTLYDLGQFRSSFQIQAWAWGVMGFALLPWLIVLLVRIARDSRKRLKQMREDLQLMRDELAARHS